MSFYKDKKVCVLGGTGLVGSFLVEKLIAEGAIVRSIGRWCDLRNYENCLLAVDGQDYVFNLAAKMTGVEYNRTHHPEMFEDNILLQMYPIKAAWEKKVKKFLQCSTVCVYPHDAIVPTPESEGVKGKPEDTNEGYGWAKRMGEMLARLYNERGLPTVVTRFSNVYGPRDHFESDISHVIPAFIVKCLNDKKITAWGTGNQARSFLYTEDAAIGLMKVMEFSQTPEPINIGGCEMITMKDLFDLIVRLLGTENEVTWDTTKPNGHERREVDTTKLKEITGWTASTPLEEGIRNTIAWWKDKQKDGIIS